MELFDIEQVKGYAIVPNYHQRDKTISLKAKGLLSQMFSLPNEWDYTLKGLAHINLDGIDAIRTAVQELEKAGYIKRTRIRDENGRLRGTKYKVYALPRPPTSDSPMGDLQEFAAQMCESIGSATGHIAAVSDRDSIIALHGAPKRELMDKPNSPELERLMEQRKHYLYRSGDAPIFATDGAEKYQLGAASPILSQGDLMGCVMLLLDEGSSPLQEADQYLARTAAGFLGRQMES